MLTRSEFIDYFKNLDDFIDQLNKVIKKYGYVNEYDGFISSTFNINMNIETEKIADFKKFIKIFGSRHLIKWVGLCGLELFLKV